MTRSENKVFAQHRRVGDPCYGLDPLIHSAKWVAGETLGRESAAREAARVIPDECFCGMWSFRHTANACPGVSG